MWRNRDVERQKAFNRRAILLGGFKLALVGTLVGRLYYLQVVQSDRYRMLAEENRINLRLLPPPRGTIVDRFGIPLAENIENYRIVMVPEQAGDVEKTLIQLSHIVSLSAAERESALKDIKRQRSFLPVTVRENLSWREVSSVEVNAPDLPGVSIEVGRTRRYPFGALSSHIVGYVGAVSEKEQSGDDPLLQLPDFRIGKSGIEKSYDLGLRGRAGSSQVEVNARGRIIRELSREEGLPGKQVPVTLDIELQRAVTNRLGEESAASVVLDVHTGEILAMASNPSYEPNLFAKGISSADWKRLISDPRKPLTDKCTAGQYAPGSTFKMVVALAALDAGVISERDTVFCPGHYELGRGRFHCWKRGGHGHVHLIQAIMKSCDVYFYEIARRVGVDAINAMALKMGVGEKLGIDIPGERKGLVPTKAWKLATLGKHWNLGETLIAGIGQGFVLATPLQLAVMTARIANGGMSVTPHLSRFTYDGEKLVRRTDLTPQDLGLDPRHVKLVQQGMIDVVNAPGGTARRSRIDEEGMEMAGKTGTAQVRRISKSERASGVRKNEDLPWHLRDHALFVGYAPVDAPRYAVSVIVEHGGGGSRAAAPIAKDVLVETLKRDPSRQLAGNNERPRGA